MSFLQPALLLALPLVVLPVVIHLINQRRYQTLPWGAMRFLLSATRMSLGFARLRQWLILLLRMLVIGALVLAVSRPLASGRFSLSGRADTTILLLDRSPSMEQQLEGVPKLTLARQRLARALRTVGSSRWILIDSATGQPREIASADALLELPDTGPTSASTDLPALLQAAADYIRGNRTGRTEIWIASDLRTNDWRPESGQWRDLRSRFLEFAQSVRFHLLALPQTAAENVAVRVTDVHWVSADAGAGLSISLDFTRKDLLAQAGVASQDTQRADRRLTFPVQLEVDGARSELTMEMTGDHDVLQDHRLALSENQARGWGRVTLPADANQADNDFYFAFATPPPRRTLVVSEDPSATDVLQLAASIGPDRSIPCVAEVVPRGQLATAAWEETALLLWQAPLPKDESAALVRTFVAQGGRVLFLPPHQPGGGEWSGVHWGHWVDARRAVTSWRGDEDLLASAESGAALPVGKLAVHRYCTLVGALTALATLDGGAALLARPAAARPGVYFLATTPAASSLATSGVVWYVAIQRALAAGAQRLAGSRNLVAGQARLETQARSKTQSQPKTPSRLQTEPPSETPLSLETNTAWRRLAGGQDALSTDYAEYGGVYEVDGNLLAVNRSLAEDHAPVLTDAEVSELFKGLDFVQVNGAAASDRGLIEEIWRTFLALMMVAMILEAALCLPAKTTSASFLTKPLTL